MKMTWWNQSLLLCLLGCSSVPEVGPSGPIASFGTTPTIDGVFEEGEWDDAEIVQAGRYQQFRIKHDSVNLYYALIGDGGNLHFSLNGSIHVLHASAQLGSAVYSKPDTSPAHSLSRAFVWELYGLQNESPTEVSERMDGYLAENGWVGSIGGNGGQTEFAISFDWLGLTPGSGRFVETPRHHLHSGRLFSPEQIEELGLMALSLEERREQYPTLNWPVESAPNDSLNAGYCPEVVRFDPTVWGKVWIDLGG